MANRLEAMPMPTLARRYAVLRDRLLTNPRFVSWAGAFPLTRFVARKRAAALFDICAGFVYSQVLFSCVTLGLFDMLREGPLSSDFIARRTGLPPEEALRLLQAAQALNLVEKRGKYEFGLGQLGAAVVANPGIAAMVEHHAHLYADLADPVALLRGESSGTALSSYWPYAAAERPGELGEDQVAAYSRLMALSLPLLAEEVLDAYPLNRHRCLLDVGGGEGVFLAAAAARAPRLKLMLFDLPPVADRARTRLALHGLQGRAEIFGGDFLSDRLPKGADVVSLVRVILDHDDETALRILKAAREALPSDGVLLLAEPLAEIPGAEAMGAYFGLYLKAMGGGRPRNFGQIQGLLTAAGFGRARLRRGRHVLRTAIVIARPQAHVLR
jgi:demethylspheroidene O-methyltransferase